MSKPASSSSIPPSSDAVDRIARAGESSRMTVGETHHPLASTSAGTDSAAQGQQPTSALPSSSSLPLRSIEASELLKRRNESGSSNIGNVTDPPAQATPPPPAQTAQQADATDENITNEARNVRRNMLITAWNGFALLTKGRKWVLILRMGLGLAQLVAGIVILSLPSSLGDSYSTPEKCDPEGMFVFLTLHIARVFCSVPIDVYLGLSPHQTPRSRRAGANGLLDRERHRVVGSLPLDRKLGRFSDLLGICHIVLFIVGNYIVWTSVECSRAPADSRPLWIMCVCMLCITYVIIFEVGLMIFLVVFFLPLLIAVLRALGLANRLPQRAIHPETGKIAQSAIEEQSRLVYFTPAKEERPREVATCTSRDDLERLGAGQQGETSRDNQNEEAIAKPLPLSRTATAESKVPSAQSAPVGPTTPTPIAPSRKRLGLLFGYKRKAKEGSKGERTAESEAGGSDDRGNSPCPAVEPLKYPLHPVPAHRATCPICLCDFEEVPLESRRRHCSPPPEEDRDGADNEEEVEPLRLLRCGHVMHMTCVDQWLTTVSGRCPVCQSPVVGTDSGQGNDA